MGNKEVNGVLVAAHELKAPFSLMRQLAFALQNSGSQAMQERICSQMVNVSERAMLQINDLMKVARLEEGLFEMEPVSVRGVCETVLRDTSSLFGFDRKSLSIKYKNRQKLAIANPELLYSVIYNICTNAMHYSNIDTVSHLTVSDTKDHIRIDVRDFGPALPSHIWHEFQNGTLSQPTQISMRPGSSALGLYIATQFTNYMHAHLMATRHRDGTSFFVDLPVSRQTCLFG